MKLPKIELASANPAPTPKIPIPIPLVEAVDNEPKPEPVPPAKRLYDNNNIVMAVIKNNKGNQPVCQIGDSFSPAMIIKDPSED